MTSDSFVPTDFEVPPGFDGSGFHFEPLGPKHNERDYEAWTSSMDHIHATPGFEESTWPREMTLEENLADMEMHARHFEERSGFTYSILDGEAVIGCLYIYPATDSAYDAEARSWVTASRGEMDAVVWREVSAWLAGRWPFESVLYAERM